MHSLFFRVTLALTYPSMYINISIQYIFARREDCLHIKMMAPSCNRKYLWLRDCLDLRVRNLFSARSVLTISCHHHHALSESAQPDRMDTYPRARREIDRHISSPADAASTFSVSGVDGLCNVNERERNHIFVQFIFMPWRNVSFLRVEDILVIVPCIVSAAADEDTVSFF